MNMEYEMDKKDRRRKAAQQSKDSNQSDDRDIFGDLTKAYLQKIGKNAASSKIRNNRLEYKYYTINDMTAISIYK